MKLNAFQNPDNLLRPTPFWAINDRITPEETARQLTDMRDKGLGGGFFHSRAGLITDYLGEDWFASMEAAIEAAEKTDGYVWLYDEDLWPSGNAGGQVAALGEEFRQAYVEALLVTGGRQLAPAPESEILRAYRLTDRDGLSLREFEDCGTSEAHRADGEHLVIRKRLDPKRGWWSGESYANLLNPDVTKKFIELTHEVYRKHLGRYFGKRVPGIFTDEPQLCSKGGFPWFDGLPGLYREWAGREFWHDFPMLFFDGADHRLIRQAMHRVLLRQFVCAYSRPIFDWCAKNNLAHTGHYNAEDTLLSQIMNHGGSIMAHYRCQQIPGVDHLCRKTEPLFLTLKQVSSAVRQLGAPYALNEIFGVSHHTNSFEDFRWLADYSMVQGAVFLCPHLTWYSMRGKRKRDYPPNWNYQQTYWDDLGSLNDYFARLATVLSRGKSTAEILVLHPMEEATASLRRGLNTTLCTGIAGNTSGVAAVHWLNQMLLRLMTAVQDAGYDFDLGDEGYLADMGRVEKGKLVVGRAAYRVIVVPPAKTWRPSTHALLRNFAKAGGKLVFAGDLPTEQDCSPSPGQWRQLLAMPSVAVLPAAHFELIEYITRAQAWPYSLSLSDGGPSIDVKTQHRVDGAQQFFFMVNTDRNSSKCLRLCIRTRQSLPLAQWDATSGKAVPIHSTVEKGWQACEFELAPTGSILLAAGKGVLAGPKTKRAAAAGAIRKQCELAGPWPYSPSEENVLVLERLSFSTDKGATWSDEDLDHRIRQNIAQHFGTGESLGWQPWVAIRKKMFDARGGTLQLRYRFDCALSRVANAAVVMEDLAKGRLCVNGKPVNTENCGWHWDRGFGKVDIAPLVRKGVNEILFEIDYGFLSEVEAAYIVGDFGVRLKNLRTGEICGKPKTLRNGSWVEQGFPFFSGSMTYKTTWRKPATRNARYFLRLLRPACTLAKVRVNGQDLPKLMWRPFEQDITRELKGGVNEIEIELVSSRQNTHGPRHLKEGDSFPWHGPNTFQDDELLSEEINLYPYGLLGGAEILERSAP